MNVNKLVLLLLIALCFGSPAVFAQVLGDVNGDNNISIVDSLLTAQYYVGIEVENFNVQAADINCDGAINIVDSLIMAQVYIGLIDPPCLNADFSTDTKFEFGRGFYEQAFTEIISNDIPGGMIYYTLDGSDPRTSAASLSGTSPVKVLIDPSDASNRPLTPAVTLRAFAKNSRGDESNVDTQTYIFVESVKNQSAQSPGEGWPEPGSGSSTGFPGGFPGGFQDFNQTQLMDYEMDPDVVNDPRYADKMTDALLSLPSVSLVTDLANLFDKDTGIYVNAEERGDEWERPASVEIIYPDDEESVQAETGIRIRNGYHRIASNPKHSFRLFFRKEYGDSKLEYKLFGDEGVDEFDKIDFRSATNYNWAYYGDAKNTMIRDVVCRDIQAETDQPYTRSRYYHLYLNGIYWGLFQTQERVGASYAENYFGGDEDDYDVVKAGVQENNYKLELADGNLDLVTELHGKMIEGFERNDAYFNVIARNVDGSSNPLGRKLVDPENLADYMIGVFYSGDKDGPISTFFNHGLNNFFGVINRNNPEGFKWFHHDAEHTLDLGAKDRIGPWSDTQWKALNLFNPQILNEFLMANEEYALLFADRAYRHLTNHGAMSPEGVAALINKRASQIDPGGVIAISARWGDMQARAPFTYDDHWKPAVQNILDNFVPARSAEIITLLRQKGWYPTINPPEFRFDGNELAVRIAELPLGSEILLESKIIEIIEPENEAGYDDPPALELPVVYYTTDGSDPRGIGGGVANSAFSANSAVTVKLTARGIKARTLYQGEWSALREVFTKQEYQRNDILITEVNYNPEASGNFKGRDLEFIELKNNSAKEIILTGFSFTKGIIYNFPEGSVLPANSYLVVAALPVAFKAHYNSSSIGPYSGSLDNSGEKITLKDGYDNTIFSVKFNDKEPWPESADGDGFSLVPVEENSAVDPDETSYWTASAQLKGSPGQKDANSF
ncbi:MAG: lamin tail domain-containing protein [Spirochaetales bacterium]|nr:lamin tail domain-containing protein [Spirochaetales bacterium]